MTRIGLVESVYPGIVVEGLARFADAVMGFVALFSIFGVVPASCCAKKLSTWRACSLITYGIIAMILGLCVLGAGIICAFPNVAQWFGLETPRE